MKKFDTMPENRNVTIVDNYHYAPGFKGTNGIIVKVTPEGCNIWLNVNGAGSYEDSIYWFPFNCFTQN